MRKSFYVFAIFMFVSSHLYAQAPGIGKFYSNESVDKVFNATMQATTAVRFSIKNIDKAQGTIQAESQAGTSVVNLFVIVRQDSTRTVVEATFTKPLGVIGSLPKFTRKYGEQIKKTITDLEINVEGEEKDKKKKS